MNIVNGEFLAQHSESTYVYDSTYTNQCWKHKQKLNFRNDLNLLSIIFP